MNGFLGPGTGDEGSPQEVARRASWALQFWGGGFFEVQGLRGLRADATDSGLSAKYRVRFEQGG